MNQQDLADKILDIAGVPKEAAVIKSREDGRQLKANALFEGSSSPGSPRTPLGILFCEKNSILAIEGAKRRMSLDVPYPEAVIILDQADGANTVHVIGYGDSQIARRLATAFKVSLITAARPKQALSNKSESTIDTLKLLRTLEESPNVILEGPPGTGKTSTVIELVRELAKDQKGLGTEEFRLSAMASRYKGGLDDLLLDDEHLEKLPVAWELVQMHANYNYDDLVRRITPSTEVEGLEFIVQDRLLPKICAIAEKVGPQTPVILVLDEINRCNISAVLGEFIFAIDPGHRGTPVRLQYQGSGLAPSVAVPKNLWIIGTMNSADRSIALMDYAVRRRFRFINIPAQGSIIPRWYSAHEGFGRAARELFEVCNEGLPSNLLVSHSAFLIDPLPAHTWMHRLARMIAYHVAPLLIEYGRESFRVDSSLRLGGDVLPLEKPIELAAAIVTWLEKSLKLP